MLEQFAYIDLPALLSVCLASILCAIMGSFLVLQRQAVLVDAISHSILPGIVISVILSSSFSMIYVMSGAVISSLITVLLVYILQSRFRIEQGAAIGAVFTTMFALGVVLLETSIGSKVHLDTQHVLYGALDLSYWPAPISFETMPNDIKTLMALLLILIVLVVTNIKEIRLVIFDPAYAKLLGFNVRAYLIVQMILTAIVAVAAFQAMGSVLVIALFICPAACARLLVDTIKAQLALSSFIALLCAITGYFSAAYLPLILGFENSLNAAAMIATLSGLCVWITIVIVFFKNNRYFMPINTVIS